MALVCSWADVPIDAGATAAWVQAIASAFAIVASVWIVNWQHRREAARERHRNTEAQLGRLDAIEAEIRFCSAQCAVYVVALFKENIGAPAYRLPRIAYDFALPPLLSEGALSQGAMTAIGQIYLHALSFNRCLDILETLRLERGDTPGGWILMGDEANRAAIKALHLMPKDAPQRQVCPETIGSTESHLEAALTEIASARQAMKAGGARQPQEVTF